ncbi:MAG: Gfo/Idh/MocA family oxidoreductase [Tepidisphaeraceae bacterium]
MSELRIGVVGVGNMGSGHVKMVPKMPGAKLTGVADINPDALEKQKPHAPDATFFPTASEMIRSGKIDAITVATPHYDHVPIAIEALKAGLHVLVEKPIAVSTTAARQLVDEAQKHPNLVFGIMFNQRTNPLYRKMRELIAAGELGDIRRITWLITDWFRTHAYYASGGWRTTWEGEGGGVLINQCPHNLDLIQWITGISPSRVTAIATVGKTHPIEVEDDVSAILEYPNGATGHFVTTTGEAPGTNRLEIAGDRGKMIAEDGKLTFHRTLQSVKHVNETSPNSFATIETWKIDVPLPRAAEGNEHERLMRNFVEHILDRSKPLIAPGIEGVKGLELGNAIQMSGLTRKPIDLPLNGADYDAFLADMTRKYKGRKSLATKEAVVDMAASSASFR